MESSSTAVSFSTSGREVFSLTEADWKGAEEEEEERRPAGAGTGRLRELGGEDGERRGDVGPASLSGRSLVATPGLPEEEEEEGDGEDAEANGRILA